jgi:hypothetical protein
MVARGVEPTTVLQAKVQARCFQLAESQNTLQGSWRTDVDHVGVFNSFTEGHQRR